MILHFRYSQKLTYSVTLCIAWCMRPRRRSVYMCSGSSLEQIHIFALAHILRRPIIVYGIKYVKSYQGDNIGLARFQGMSSLTGCCTDSQSV